MTCEHAACTNTATVKTRFGNGYWRHGKVKHRQTYVHYCSLHLEAVEKLFRLCDVRALAEAA